MKRWYESKTLWVNAVAFTASVAAGFGLDVGPELQADLVAGTLALVNIALRFATRTAIR